ncbi:wd40 repeat family [Anaeramoeba flamelloides]|uniref:Wd40 repeat family n=1 Tax=Anaeramoeba flamelloides TaxID=1746091 RepID=A0AAV7Z3N0_9EUKA|nr:wd40 repeat family [Anaeramoeba flamelloides]
MEYKFSDDISSFTESHQEWTKNKKHFYDFFLNNSIGRTFTCQWVNDQSLKNSDFQYIILGQQRNKSYDLSVVKVNLDPKTINDSQQNKFQDVFSENQRSEINRARHQPGNPNIIAAIQESGSIILLKYNYFNQNSNNDSISITVKHEHTCTGYGLAWNPYNNLQFISGAYDKTIILWDVDRIASKLSKLNKFNDHDGEVEQIALWDTRVLEKRIHSFIQHSDKVYRVCFSPTEKNVFASISEGNNLIIWDYSKIGQEQIGREADIGPPEMIFTHTGHTEMIRDFDWNPHIPWTFTSVDDDDQNQVWKVKESVILDDEENNYFKQLEEL